MTPPASSTSTPARSSSVRQTGFRQRRAHSRLQREPSRREQRLLGRYTDGHGRLREVIARKAAAGSTLVIDRDCSTLADPRLVAHLAADEPADNAALVCDSYLRYAARGGRCRPLRPEDAHVVPFTDRWEDEPDALVRPNDTQLLDERARRYSLELVNSGMSIPELRWCRRDSRSSTDVHEIVSLREAVASLQRYEPLRALTGQALAASEHEERASMAVLRAELARVLDSPIVLNRRLRELVLVAVEQGELNMSEIALRCGRVKRDRRGNESGETSWLARRIGLLPEGGQSIPTPWIHSDVLALIARCGLGISPREAEL